MNIQQAMDLFELPESRVCLGLLTVFLFLISVCALALKIKTDSEFVMFSDVLVFPVGIFNRKL